MTVLAKMTAERGTDQTVLRDRQRVAKTAFSAGR